MSLAEIDGRAPRTRFENTQEKFANRKRLLSRARRRASALSQPLLPPHIDRWTPLRLLQAILDRGDIIALSNDQGRPGVHLLLSMPQYFFEKMIAVAAADEDAEDTDGTEYGQDEEADDESGPSLGSLDAKIDQSKWGNEGCWIPDHVYGGGGHSDLELDEAYSEPSLGSNDSINQTHWADGDRLDREDDDDAEPDHEDGYSPQERHQPPSFWGPRPARPALALPDGVTIKDEPVQAPRSFFRQGERHADAYALKGVGGCLDPIVMDGDKIVALSTREPLPGDVVVIHFRDGRRPLLKLLVSPPLCRPEDFKPHSESTVMPMVILEMLNPPSRLVFRLDEIASLHVAIGVLGKNGINRPLASAPVGEPITSDNVFARLFSETVR